MIRSTMSVLLACGALAITACETGSGTRPGPNENPSIKSVTPSTGSVNVSVTTEGRIAVVVERGGAYDGQINLSIVGLPNGVVGTFTPALLGTFNTTSELSLTVFPTAVAGTTTATIRASGVGVTEKTVPLTITVMTPSVSLTAGSGSVTVPRAGSVTVPITIVRSGGFIDAVALAALNVPTGVTATLSPTTIASGATTSTLTLSAAIGAPLGTGTMNIRTSALDVAALTVPLNVTVTDAPAPTFQLSPAAQQVIVVRGSSAQTTVNIERAGGMVAPISLSMPNLPAGITATLTPANVTGTSAQLQFDVAPTVLPGNRVLEVRGSAPGLPDRSTTVTLVVQPLGIAVLTPAAVTLPRGGNATLTLSVAKQTGVNETVTVIVAPPPNGLIVQGIPSFTNGGGTTLSAGVTVTAPASLVAGTYTLTFVASAPSGLTSTSTTTVTVTP